MQLAGQIARAAAIFTVDEVTRFLSYLKVLGTLQLRCIILFLEGERERERAGLLQMRSSGQVGGGGGDGVIFSLSLSAHQIVVFDDGVEGSSNKPPKWSEDGSESCGLFLSRILKYMETPQYLRHALIPKHNGLQFAVSKILLLLCSVFLIKCNAQIHVHSVCQIAYAAGGSATFGCATSSSQA